MRGNRTNCQMWNGNSKSKEAKWPIFPLSFYFHLVNQTKVSSLCSFCQSIIIPGLVARGNWLLLKHLTNDPFLSFFHVLYFLMSPSFLSLCFVLSFLFFFLSFFLGLWFFFLGGVTKNLKSSFGHSLKVQHISKRLRLCLAT